MKFSPCPRPCASALPWPRLPRRAPILPARFSPRACLMHAWRAETAQVDRDEVRGDQGANSPKADLGRPRALVLVQHTGLSSGCFMVPNFPVRSPPPWGACLSTRLASTRAPGRSCSRWRVGRAGCSGTMRWARRVAATGVPVAVAGAGRWRGARGRAPSQFQPHNAHRRWRHVALPMELCSSLN